MRKIGAIILAVTIMLAMPLTSYAATVSGTLGVIIKKSGYKVTNTGYIKPSSGASMYELPSKKSKKIKTIKQNVKVKYAKYNDKYYLVKFDKKYGFVSVKNISKKKITVAKAKYSLSYFRRAGVINWGGWRWTWYSETVLPGNGLNIPGRHVDDSGYICDKNDYICLASSSLKRGTVVDTPFGKKGKIYDSGCPSSTLDVYIH